jgi:MFS family permease
MATSVGQDVIATESTSLLPNRQTTSSCTGENASYTLVIFKLYALTCLYGISFQVLSLAQTRIYESIYCCKYNPAWDQNSCAFNFVPEHLCKTPQIQQGVSTLKGWLEFFDSLPGLILAIPFGVWADSHGRRKLLLLNIVLLVVKQLWITGVTVFARVIPLKVIWLEAIFDIFAGGWTVFEMLIVVC